MISLWALIVHSIYYPSIPFIFTPIFFIQVFFMLSFWSCVAQLSIHCWFPYELLLEFIPFIIPLLSHLLSTYFLSESFMLSFRLSEVQLSIYALLISLRALIFIPLIPFIIYLFFIRVFYVVVSVLRSQVSTCFRFPVKHIRVLTPCHSLRHNAPLLPSSSSLLLCFCTSSLPAVPEISVFF